ncbi:MAG: thiopurine S-methyltransferase [Pseudomonadota bacterium]
MEAQFWHDRWSQGQTAFHEGRPNDLLVSHWAGLDPGHHVFVPLAGKTVDMIWLRAQGHRVTGIELDESAVKAFFDENEMAPDVSEVGPFTVYSADDITLYVGDIFALTAQELGPVDIVYDRAALVALPDHMRTDYAAHMPGLTGHAPQFVVTFDYDQSNTPGPPFSVPEQMLRGLYGSSYLIRCVETRPITGRFTKRSAGSEVAWSLTTG